MRAFHKGWFAGAGVGAHTCQGTIAMLDSSKECGNSAPGPGSCGAPAPPGCCGRMPGAAPWLEEGRLYSDRMWAFISALDCGLRGGCSPPLVARAAGSVGREAAADGADMALLPEGLRLCRPDAMPPDSEDWAAEGPGRAGADAAWLIVAACSCSVSQA